MSNPVHPGVLLKKAMSKTGLTITDISDLSGINVCSVRSMYRLETACNNNSSIKLQKLFPFISCDEWA